ncbi:MAG TPA: PAS domain-containing protein [Burkholderiales bacterium]
MRDPQPASARTDEPLPVMLWRARPDLSCDYLSPQWLEFTGYTEAQALGDGWSRGMHPEDLARWLDTCLRAFDAREPFEIEYRLRRRDGEYRWMLDRAQPRFSADGLFQGFVGACIDIHERKRAEQETARALERERRLRLAQERILSGLLDLSHPLLDGVRVLIVDPDPAERETMSRMLAVAGAHTRAAANADEALRAVGAFHPDVLLSEVGARSGEGYGLIRSVRALPAERGGGLRAAALTVPAQAAEGLRAVAAGYDAQLAKPVEPVALLATVARLAQPAV